MSTEVFRATLDMLDQPLLISSGDIPATSRVLYSNPALNRVSGFSPERLLGLPISATLVDPLWLAGPFDPVSPAPLGKTNMPLKRADGTVRLARWRVDGHGQPGESRFFLIRVAPIESRDSEDSFPRLLSEIRHELGNPINSIKAALTLIRRSPGTLTPEKMSFYLEAVFSELERVERVLESLRRLGEKPADFPTWPPP